MTAIDILVKEHDSILKMIEVTQIILNTDDETSINFGHVEQIIDFIKNFADKYHHLKEENILFMKMEESGMSRDFGPIAMMLHEHTEGRSYIKLAGESVEKYKTGDIYAFVQIKCNLLNYCRLLVNHIDKENTILYPMAERILPVNVQVAMSESFEETNTSMVTNEYFDKFLKLVNELSITNQN